MFIYKTTNLVNNKIYIGQTAKPKESNYLGSGYILLRAIGKYGRKNFVREIIEECATKEILNEREIFYIQLFSANTRSIGYNVSIGGNGGNLGEEVNKKISEAIKKGGWLIGNQHLKGKIPYNKGVPMSEEQKQKLRKPKSEEAKLKYSITKIGKGMKPILCLNNDIVYSGIVISAKELNLKAPHIVAVLKGRAKATKGYKFRYV